MTSKPIILLIGANQGIGYHAAHQLAAIGDYIVLLGARDASKGAQAVQQILANKETKVNPESIVPITIDLTSDESIFAAVKTVEESYGRLDIVCRKSKAIDDVP